MLPSDPKAPWPPRTAQNAAYGRYGAWYEGDPTRLAAAYAGFGPSSTPETGRRRWMFWAKRDRDPDTRIRLHVPVAADLATASADLLFAEPPTIKTPDNDTTQERLDEVLADAGLANTLLEGGELAAAFGGVYLRVCWDSDAADHPWIDCLPADRAVPEWAYGRLKAVTFWQVVADDVWRHLERHEPGRIEHGLYRGTRDQLGRLQPLTDSAVTAGLAPNIDADEGNAVLTGVPNLTAVYVPNMRPNRADRLSPVGRSDYDGIEGVMDALDETWTSWMRDIRLGRARIIVPNELLRTAGKGSGAAFDADQEVFVPLPGAAPGDVDLVQNQFAIRVAEHRDTAVALLERIVSTAGYSARTFGLDDGSQATATEVNASERRSLITRAKKVRYWTPGIAAAVEALLAIDRAVFGANVVPQRPVVEFPDAVEENPLTVAQTMQALRHAEAASTDTLVRLGHPQWGDDQVDAEVARILAESGRSVADPSGFPV